MIISLKLRKCPTCIHDASFYVDYDQWYCPNCERIVFDEDFYD
jgi:hypothetical protein